jgi:transposase-like protein
MPRRWRRSITPAFKAQVFLELLSGQRSSPELCREHSVSHSLLTASKGTALNGLPTFVRGRNGATRSRRPRRSWSSLSVAKRGSCRA